MRKPGREWRSLSKLILFRSLFRLIHEFGCFLLAGAGLHFLALEISKISGMRNLTLSRTLITLSVSVAMVATSLAQRSPHKVEVDAAPNFEQLQSPDVSISASKAFKPKDWLEIEIKFKVKKIMPKPKDDYVDSMNVKWFVVVKGEDNKRYRMEKTIKHINIPLNEDVYSSVYLSPNTLKRITGKNNAGKNDLTAVGGEIEYNGTMVGFFTEGAKKGWWRQPMESVTTTDKFPLLNKNETPFKLFWYDRYAEIAPKKD